VPWLPRLHCLPLVFPRGSPGGNSTARAEALVAYGTYTRHTYLHAHWDRACAPCPSVGVPLPCHSLQSPPWLPPSPSLCAPGVRVPPVCGPAAPPVTLLVPMCGCSSLIPCLLPPLAPLRCAPGVRVPPLPRTGTWRARRVERARWWWTGCAETSATPPCSAGGAPGPATSCPPTLSATPPPDLSRFFPWYPPPRLVQKALCEAWRALAVPPFCVHFFGLDLGLV